LGVHNILFSSDYKKDAPAGCENWFVLINTLPDNGHDWKSEVEKEHVWTPASIEEETGSYRGSLYGISSNTKVAVCH